jgi:hypothetical protein
MVFGGYLNRGSGAKPTVNSNMGQRYGNSDGFVSPQESPVAAKAAVRTPLAIKPDNNAFGAAESSPASGLSRHTVHAKDLSRDRGESPRVGSPAADMDFRLPMPPSPKTRQSAATNRVIGSSINSPEFLTGVISAINDLQVVPAPILPLAVSSSLHLPILTTSTIMVYVQQDIFSQLPSDAQLGVSLPQVLTPFRSAPVAPFPAHCVQSALICARHKAGLPWRYVSICGWSLMHGAAMSFTRWPSWDLKVVESLVCWRL